MSTDLYWRSSYFLFVFTIFGKFYIYQSLRNPWIVIQVFLLSFYAYNEHFSSIDQCIKFTGEDSRQDGSMPFLDILVTPMHDGSLSTIVYRKPTHTDLYCHHTISSKYSVVSTLHYRFRTVCSNHQLLQKEEEHLHKELIRCKYPAWALNKIKLKIKAQVQNNNKRGINNSASNTTKSQRLCMVVPYTKGLSESLKKVCNKHGVQVYFRGSKTIRSLLVVPKNKDPILKKSGVIYRYKCDRVECDEEYIGEPSRTFGERFKEHQKAPSPIYDHSNTTGHTTTIENFSIVGREHQNLIRTIKEALYIKVNNPSINRNRVKHHLPHIWDEVLFNTSEPKLN